MPPTKAQHICSLAGDASPSNPEVLRTLYSVLLKTRLLEEKVHSLVRSGHTPAAIGPLLGGEATEVGACIGLEPDDSFSASHPKLAADVIAGKPLERVFRDLFGGHNSNPNRAADQLTEPFRMVPQTSSLTGQFDIAAGIALAYRDLGKTNVVVALANDGLAALGFWHEAASLASRCRLPIVFMVENCAHSHFNTAAPVQADEDLRDRAEAYGFPGITVDGNDLVAVWRVNQESIHRARTGAGPTLIECRTWRWPAGAESSNGRSRPKPPNAWQNDPLLQMEHYMKKRSLWKRSWKDQLAADYLETLRTASKSATDIS